MKHFTKIMLMLCILFFSASSVFGLEEYVSAVYGQIDTAFDHKSESELNNILAKNSNDIYYPLMENYAVKKIRRLVVNNKYDFAMDALLVVIENNLDNTDAVEMYASVSDAYKAQKEFEQQQELKRQQEIARVEAEKESKRASAERQYIASAKSDGGSVYVTGKETKRSSHEYKISLGLVDLSMISSPVKEIQTVNYGLNLDIMYGYVGNSISWGFDLDGEFKFLPFIQGETKTPLTAEFEVAPRLSFNGLSKNLFFRLGYEGSITSYVSGKEILSDNFMSPFLGINLDNLKLGSLGLSAGIDYYAAHLWTPDVLFAMGAAANLEIPFTQIETLRLNFNVGIRDKILIREKGLENRASLILAIGVGNVSR